MKNKLNMKANQHDIGVSARFWSSASLAGHTRTVGVLCVTLLTVFVIVLSALLSSPIQARADQDDQFQGIPYYVLSGDEIAAHKADPIKVKMQDGEFSFDEWAYCIEASKKLPPAGEDYPYNLFFYDSTQLTTIGKSFDNPHTGYKLSADVGVALALLRGFPNDFSDMKDRFGLTDYEFYQATQVAVHFWTDSDAQGGNPFNVETGTNPDAQNKAFKELISETMTAEEIQGLAASRFVQAIPHDNQGKNWQRLMWLEPGFDVYMSKVDATNNNALPGASLRLLNGPSTQSDLYTNGSFTSSTQRQHFALLEGTYTLVEDTPPPGYDTAEPIIFKVSREGTAGPFKPRLEILNGDQTTPIEGDTIIMKDQPSITSVQIQFRKVNDQAEPLSGARFRVTGNKLTGESVDDYFNVNNEGVFTWNNFYPGMYTMVEETAPNGYQKLTDPIRFTVDKDGTLSLTNPSPSATATGTSVTVTNQKIGPFPITFKKVNDQGDPLSGARFRVTGTKLTGESINDAFTVNGNGVFTWATGGGLYPGTYSIVEETAPGGYARLTQPQAFTVGVDGRLSFPAGSAQGFSLDTTDATGTTMIIKNEKTIPGLGTVRISKNVAGEFGDKTQDFIFHFTINSDDKLPPMTPIIWKKYNENGDQQQQGNVFTGIETTVTLKHGQYIELSGLGTGGLPAGQDRVTVWEETVPGYVTTVMENGTPHPNPDTDKAYDVHEGQTNSIVFTNTRDITPTGITTTMAGYVIALGLAGAAALFVAGTSVYRLRRPHA